LHQVGDLFELNLKLRCQSLRMMLQLRSRKGGKMIMNSKKDVQDECMFHAQLQHLTVKEDEKGGKYPDG
jgi:hypothetical protein